MDRIPSSGQGPRPQKKIEGEKKSVRGRAKNSSIRTDMPSHMIQYMPQQGLSTKPKRRGVQEFNAELRSRSTYTRQERKVFGVALLRIARKFQAHASLNGRVSSF